MAVTGTIAALGAVGASAYSANKQAKVQKRQMRQAARDAEAARVQADRDFNAANQKAPNVAALQKRNRAKGSTGVSGTFLTGNSSTASNGAMLGRTTLLGG